MFVINKIIKQQKLREIMMDTEQAHKKNRSDRDIPEKEKNS